MEVIGSTPGQSSRLPRKEDAMTKVGTRVHRRQQNRLAKPSLRCTPRIALSATLNLDVRKQSVDAMIVMFQYRSSAGETAQLVDVNRRNSTGKSEGTTRDRSYDVCYSLQLPWKGK